jgi:hypothetical protein
MNITYTRPGELRKPDIDVLPDGRIRITRYVAAGHGDRDNGEVTEAIGTQDSGLTTALLVKRNMGVENGKPAIIKIYEVRSASAETQVGLPDVSYGDNGLRTVVQDFVQMSTGTYTPGTVGTSTAPTDGGCVLQQEQMQDDGTTRQIRRVYISKGLISQSDETKNNGALLLKTLVYLNDAPDPNPPTGYTLVSTQVASPNGLETTTYTFARGTGKISQDDETKNNGALLIRTIRQLSLPAVVSNPISTPSGYTLVSENYAEQDGYKIWSASYAQGTGQISQDDETKNNGALLVRSIRYLSVPSVSSNPIGTPAGYTLTNQSYADQDGHRVWTASYANGTGQISQDDETKNNGSLLVRSIRYLSTPSVSSNPITTPSGYTLVSQNYADQDGYRIWTASYAKGTGQLNLDTRFSQSTDGGTTGVTVYSISYLSVPSVSSNPITTPASTVKIVENYQDQDGYRIWNATYAKGAGVINVSTDTRLFGKLIAYHKVGLGSVPSTPTATIGGTVTLISSDSRNSDGYVVYDYRWVEAYGVIDKRIQQRSGGLIIETWTSVGSVYDGGFMQPSGVLLTKDEQNADGYKQFTVSCMQNYDTTTTVTKYPFRYPGRAKAYTASFPALGFTAYSHDVFLSSPIEIMVDANVVVSYQTSGSLGSLPSTFWNPTSWATVRAYWEGWSENAKSLIQSYQGYRTVGSPVSFTASSAYANGYTDTCMGDKVYGGSSGSITVSGGPEAPDGNTYTLTASVDSDPAFTDINGVRYFRKTTISATIPAQEALPV